MIKLHLTLKGKWFYQIAKGIKKEEYREIKPYWIKRLSATPIVHFFEFCPNVDFRPYTHIEFSNGYSPASRKMIVECKGIDIGKAVPEWSDNWQGDVFRIHLGEVLQRINF